MFLTLGIYFLYSMRYSFVFGSGYRAVSFLVRSTDVRSEQKKRKKTFYNLLFFESVTMSCRFIPEKKANIQSLIRIFSDVIFLFGGYLNKFHSLNKRN